MKILRIKRKKKDKKTLNLGSGDLNPRFSVIFMEVEVDEIKSRHIKIVLYNLVVLHRGSFSLVYRLSTKIPKENIED